VGQERDTHADRLSDLSRTRRIYDRYARSTRKQRAWASDNAGNRAIRDELIQCIRATARTELAGTGNTLDIGCGSGWLLTALQNAGIESRRLHGVDVLPERVANASARLADASILNADARALPFADHSLDLVLMITMLSSMPSREAVAAALAETVRILAPRGLLIVYEPRFPNPSNPATRRIARREFESLSGGEFAHRTLTVLPQLARRLGRSSGVVYPVLASFPILRSHQLITWRSNAT
jgi:ubiquinone/menaquinone biosynthesis C-methylase UbiE